MGVPKLVAPNDARRQKSSVKQALKRLRVLRWVKASIVSALRHSPIPSTLLGPAKGLVTNSHDRFPGLVHQTEPARIVSRTAPLSLNPKIAPFFEKDLTEELAPVWLGDFPKGRCIGPTIIYDDIVLADFTYCQMASRQEQWHVEALKLPRPRWVPGTSVVLGDLWAESYGHWLSFGLGRLAYIEREIKRDKIDHFIVPSRLKRVQTDTLKLMGIPLDKVISVADVPSIKCERLVLSTWSHFIDPIVIDFLRKEFLKSTKPSRFGKRLYISRQRSTGRRLSNEAEVLDVLEPLGFETVFCEDISFEDQVAMFAQADVILGAHGSDLSNVLFCRRGTKILELFGSQFLNTNIWTTANLVGAEYGHLIEKSPKPAGGDYKLANLDINVSIPELRKLLSLLGVTRRARAA